MKVQLPNRLIHVSVHHRRPDLDPNKNVEVSDQLLASLSKSDFRQLIREYCPSTSCEVIMENGTKFVGNAYCSPGDKFVKRRGLAVAVKRALMQTNLTRAERTTVYNTLFGRMPKQMA